MIRWPDGKKFAFTIVDDTDYAKVCNVMQVYDYLYKSGLKTTKTVWVYPSRDKFQGETLSDENYKCFIKDLIDKGFEIGFHGPGSGEFSRKEIISALDKFKDIIGYYPKIHINHAHNPDSIYWGSKRFSFPLNKLFNFFRKLLKVKKINSQGENIASKVFWGDYCKKHIKYIRNKAFSDINTLKCDKKMPYIERDKEQYSNYWFSSSDGYDFNTFIKLLSKKNIDNLICKGGCCIVYTHFALGFVDENGKLRDEFKNAIDYLSKQNGWFVPATQLLDYINTNRKDKPFANKLYLTRLDIKWFFQRVYRKLIWRV
ncbi:hypothetical protein JK636_04395 [Clostridium sp. YIM B02515]|uniref:DUF2334 domain-containing protein n=1 Tax=Clostridium rhizosphaerae TaxID=2803861 RepID=A0ABS1T6N4_9CLOT|nr:hypothetical protein [Clostridium rhizosphaerae]MBL4934995.1 hypothetical protein [Clostridium rhizosphaerae]